VRGREAAATARRSAAAGLLAVACALGAPTAAADGGASKVAAAAPSPHATEAKALFDDARALYEKGKYHEAIEKLERALELDPAGTELVYNLAVLHEKLLEFDAAEAYYRHYLDLETDPKQRERALTTLKRIEGARRTLSARRAPGAPDAPVSPGAAPAPAVPPLSTPAAQPGGADPIVITLGAVGGAGLVAGSVLGITALAMAPASTASTRAGFGIDDLQAEATRAHRLAVVADVAFVVGVVAGAAALATHFARAHRGAPPRAAFTLSIAPGGSLGVHF
jgi:tetratricopeptide (TPR) repeat protein